MPMKKKPAMKKMGKKHEMTESKKEMVREYGKKAAVKKMAMKKPVIAGKKTKLPPDYDVILPGMGYTKPTKKNPPKKIGKK